MKTNESEIRSVENFPFIIVTTGGDRIRVRSANHLFLPPFEDENGYLLTDERRSDFFEVWSDGRSKRLVAFAAITILETQDRERNQ